VPFAEVGAHRVYYERRGTGAPVLLLNGLNADHSAWGIQTDALSDRFEVVVFDNPGIGRTTGPAGYTSELFADVAIGLLDRLGIARAHVVGASMGGTIAQQIALRRPALVRSLALHCTWGRCDAYLAALFRSWAAIALAMPLHELLRQIWLWVFTPRWYATPGQMDDLERQARDNPFPQSPEAFCDQAAACIAHDVLDRCQQISAPTLITVGDGDLLAPPYHSRALAERIPGARLHVWPEMGHAPFWEIPDRFNELTVDFLAESA